MWVRQMDYMEVTLERVIEQILMALRKVGVIIDQLLDKLPSWAYILIGCALIIGGGIWFGTVFANLTL